MESALPKRNYSGKKKPKTFNVPEDMLKDLKRLADHSNLADTQIMLFILDKEIPKEIELMEQELSDQSDNI